MFDYNNYNNVAALIGATVTAILVSEERLTFQTDKGLLTYVVEGDCCSSSYFHDFYGVKNLLENGPITAAEAVELSPGDVGYHAPTWDPAANPREWQDEVQVYGFRLTTTHPKFGDVSSVFSFRNDSNGYYGGSLYPVADGEIHADQKLIDDDIVQIA